MGDSESLSFEGQNYGQDLVCGTRMRTCRHLLLDTQKNKFELKNKVKQLQRKLVGLSKKLTPLQKKLVLGKILPFSQSLNNFRNLLLSKGVSVGLKMNEFEAESVSRILIGKYFRFKGREYTQAAKEVGKKLFSFVSSLRAQNISV